MSSLRRLSLIEAHLNSKFPTQQFDESLNEYRKKGSPINSTLLLQNYLGDIYSEVMSLRSKMAESTVFNHFEEVEMSREALRKRVLQQISKIYPSLNLTYDLVQKSYTSKFCVLYAFGEYDIGLAVRLLVHLVLYIDTINNLGTKKHRNLIDRAYAFKDYGCFGMTELGHGSNVAKVETTATYDHKSRGFVLNSPTATSAKWWIGAAGKTANIAVIFAQLIVDSVDKGVHAFVVPIRHNETHENFEGVVSGDCGKKLGLDGIDNGFILFKNYYVAYDSLLDKFSSINQDGKFKSAIKNKEKRFGIMIAGLVGGRIAVISGTEENMRNGLTIALRFSAVRKQFSGSEGPELPILNYGLQRYRLIPYLAKMYAIRSSCKLLFSKVDFFNSKLEEDPESIEINEFHAILSAIKSVSTWYGFSCLQECREAVGGLGYSSFSAIGRLRASQDVNTTWEGDNSVLIQQAGKFIFKQIQKTFKGQKIQAQSLAFVNININEVHSYNPVFNSIEQLENENLIKELIVYKFNLLLHQSLLKLQENTAEATDMIDAWNKTQVYYIQEMSKSYGEYIMMTEFLKDVQKLESQDLHTGNVIRKLWLLYSIGLIEKSLISYIDIFNAGHVKIVRESMTKLCDELAYDSLKIVDALAAPDLNHGSVLGVSDGQIYKAMIGQVEKSKKVYDKPDWLPVLQELKNK